jgi:apolipoprotein N-acyltransferase
LAFLIGVLCFPAPPQGGVRGPSSTAVAVVQIRPYDAGTLRLVLHEARRRLGNRVVTAVAFPEAAFNFPLAQDDVDWLNRWVRETHIPILAGSIVRRNDRRANVVLYFKGAGVPDVYVKQKLVPFGEFIPGKPLFPKLVDLPGGDLDRGDVTPLWVLGTRKVSPLICFEIGFENLALKGVRAGADMLVVVLNDSWFSTPEGSSLQYAVAQARSRSLGIDVVVVAVRGPSAVLHPNGTPVYQGSASDPFVTLSVEGRHATIYAASGDLPLQTAGAGLACYYLAAFLRRRSIRARIARIARSSGGSSSA